MNDILSGGFGIMITLFLFILGILWFMLPFAVFGTKDKLNELIQETKKTNEQLSALRAEVTAMKNEIKDA